MGNLQLTEPLFHMTLPSTLFNSSISSSETINKLAIPRRLCTCREFICCHGLTPPCSFSRKCPSATHETGSFGLVNLNDSLKHLGQHLYLLVDVAIRCDFLVDPPLDSRFTKPAMRLPMPECLFLSFVPVITLWLIIYLLTTYEVERRFRFRFLPAAVCFPPLLDGRSRPLSLCGDLVQSFSFPSFRRLLADIQQQKSSHFSRSSGSVGYRYNGEFASSIILMPRSGIAFSEVVHLHSSPFTPRISRLESILFVRHVPNT